MAPYLLAIDAGTGGGRAVLFDRSGRQVGGRHEEWTHVAEADAPGSMSFEWESNWLVIGRCIGAAIKQANIAAGEIAAVSSTSMREGLVLYDAAGRELWACANVDSRAEEQVRQLKARGDALEHRFYEESGQTFALGAWPRILWVAQNRPGIFQRAAKVSMINDWVTARLSGEIVVEPSNGGTSGLMSLKDRNWSDQLISETELPRSLFPPVVGPGTVIGAVTERAAAETGLIAGTPVVAGGGDVQLGTVGLGVCREGESAILGGTFWQQVINIPLGRTDPTMRVRINPHAVTGLNQAECISFFIGLTMRWFRDAFCEAEKHQADAEEIDAYTLLERRASAVPPGSHGIIPIFSDAMDFGRWYHAAPSFLNLSIDPARSNKAALFRALEENAAIVSALNLERVMEFSGEEIQGPLVFAGGASKGELWTQILADVTDREIKVPEVREATALGCAAAASVGAGFHGDLVEAGKAFARFERTVEPNRANEAAYREARERWQAAYPLQKSLVDRGVTTSLWRAPGV